MSYYYSYAATPTHNPSNCSFDSKEKLWHCLQGQHIGRGVTIEQAQRALHQSLTRGHAGHTLANIHRNQRSQTTSPSKLITRHPHSHPLPQPHQHPASHAIKNIVDKAKGQLPPSIVTTPHPNATPTTTAIHPNAKPHVTHDTTSLSLPPESKNIIKPALPDQAPAATEAAPPAPVSGAQDFSKNALSGGGAPVDAVATADPDQQQQQPAVGGDQDQAAAPPQDLSGMILVGAVFVGLIALMFIL
jgi:hypothetical protein